ncbi:hypothetical protein NEFER03_1100 [Nematocida sp. LUAm3]|nr:hypothetical protein NEFER03_1100 [Nematocida sp. LUAm3]KAI5175295.1 hypothetical protein NEFER02_1224 [Nematocida sp. LUAm2]KAI5177748.1 hypothetical protein NEFER01_0972 [Nematocida sp. LUAm1]
MKISNSHKTSISLISAFYSGESSSVDTFLKQVKGNKCFFDRLHINWQLFLELRCKFYLNTIITVDILIVDNIPEEYDIMFQNAWDKEFREPSWILIRKKLILNIAYSCLCILHGRRLADLFFVKERLLKMGVLLEKNVFVFNDTISISDNFQESLHFLKKFLGDVRISERYKDTFCNETCTSPCYIPILPNIRIVLEEALHMFSQRNHSHSLFYTKPYKSRLCRNIPYSTIEIIGNGPYPIDIYTYLCVLDLFVFAQGDTLLLKNITLPSGTQYDALLPEIFFGLLPKYYFYFRRIIFDNISLEVAISLIHNLREDCPEIQLLIVNCAFSIENLPLTRKKQLRTSCLR